MGLRVNGSPWPNRETSEYELNSQGSSALSSDGETTVSEELDLYVRCI